MIFGTSYPKISGSLGDVLLEYCKVDYNFFVNDTLEQRSILTGHVIYPYARNKSEFRLDVLLCEYSGSATSSSLSKFNDIYQYKDKYFNFYPHSDFSASVNAYDVPVEYYITEFKPYYLSNDERYDGVFITISPRSQTKLQVKIPSGYGTSYGQDYGYTGW